MWRRWEWIVIAVMVGSIWGMAEVLMDAAFSWAGGMARAVVLPTFAAFLLGTQYALTKRPLAPVVAVLCAVFFKFLNVPFFACQVLAVVSIGLITAGALAFASRLQLRERWLPFWCGAAVWIFFLFFAVTMTYVLRYHWWVQGGWSRVAGYVGIAGSMAALLSVGAFWAGGHLGKHLLGGWEYLRAVRPGYCFGMMLALAALAGAISVAL